MHQLVPWSVVTLAMSVPAAAQDLMGILNNTDTSFTSRGSATVPNQNLAIVYDRLDKEFYAGWGIDPANPGMRQILGMRADLQDQVGTSPETFRFLVFTESAAQPNYPDVSTPLGTIGPIPTPASTATGPVAWTFTASFTTPVLAPASADVYLGVELPNPAVGTYPTDGMSCWALYYVSVTSGISDLPGTAHPSSPPEVVGNGGFYVPSPLTGPFYTVTPRQWKIEPILAGATGVAGTITNQTTAPASNLAPGTSSQGSGLYPDALNPPLNAGRVDDVAGRWFKSNTPNNTPVFFVLSFHFGPEIPASGLLAGSTGVVCVDLPSTTVIGIQLTTNNQAFQVISIPAAARAVIGGMTIVHQAAGLNAAGGVDASPCMKQML